MFEKKLTKCDFCPRNCNVNRYKSLAGYCRTGAGYYIASIIVHRGEEPPISGDRGICNVFFAHCNLQCVFCQNYQISRNKTDISRFELSLEQTVDNIIKILDTGINIVGFVSPSHFAIQVIQIVKTLYSRGYFPTIVYNSNGYDKIETLKMLESYVDVYLPDFKYLNPEIAAKYSKARNYPDVAKAAITEMYRQKGDLFVVNKRGYAESGLMIRHLVLPNNIDDSINILRFIASISVNIHISLMSQYYPVADAFKFPEISRTLTKKEYETVIDEAINLGFHNIWIQDLDSNTSYRPDFNYEHPFEYKTK